MLAGQLQTSKPSRNPPKSQVSQQIHIHQNPFKILRLRRGFWQLWSPAVSLALRQRQRLNEAKLHRLEQRLEAPLPEAGREIEKSRFLGWILGGFFWGIPMIFM
jgi:hypothetical protein